MRFSLEIQESDKQIAALVSNALSKRLSKALLTAGSRIQSDVRRVFRQAITSSGEYASLTGGDLQGHIGVPNASSRMAEIISVWIKSILVTIDPPRSIGGSLRGGLKISIVKDWQAALTSSAASFITDKGQTIPWLEWLLLAGDSQFIVDYDVELNLTSAQQARSRTGIGIMVTQNGSRWGVPSEFSGTASDNFVTRAIMIIRPDIERFIKNHVTRSF
tara:strand:+ start:508 stop:1161 length:654 start_codon:yes stop_codon:yes gene_type:complete